MDSAALLPPNLGIHDGQVHDRSDLVVLSILGAGFSAAQAWSGVDADWLADPGDLRDRGCGQRGGRVAFVFDDSPRQGRECCPQDVTFTLRGERGPHCVRISDREYVGSGDVAWSCGSSSPGIFRQSLHLDLGHVPGAGGRVGGGYRGDGRCDRRDVDRKGGGVCVAMDRQLLDSVSYGWLGVLAGGRGHSGTRAAGRTCFYFFRRSTLILMDLSW